MATLTPHCSLSYHDLALDLVEPFAVGVRDGIYGNNPPFTAPPLTQLQFEALITAYVNTRGAYVNGGAAQKGPFLAAKNSLMTALDNAAEYVDEDVAMGVEATILLSGFHATKTGSSSAVIPVQPAGIIIKRGIAGELIAECPTIDGAEYYGCIITETAPLPTGITFSNGRFIYIPDEVPNPGVMSGLQIDLNKNRIKHFTALNHDLVYYFYFYCANAAGVSPLSEPVDMVCW